MFEISNISIPPQNLPPRILFLGVEGIGKSTFAAACAPDGTPSGDTNNIIFIPAAGEQGLEGLAVPSVPAVNSFEELMEVLGVLYVSFQSGELEFGTTLVLDSVTSFEALVIAEAIARDPKATGIDKLNGGYGNQELAINAVWTELLSFFDVVRAEFGVSCILTGHVRTRKAKDPMASSDYDTYEQDLRLSGANHLQRWADAVLFANYKVTVNAADKKGIGKGRRVIYTQKRPAHPGKVRQMFGALPYEIPMSWNEWKSAVSATGSTIYEEDSSTNN